MKKAASVFAISVGIASAVLTGCGRTDDLVDIGFYEVSIDDIGEVVQQLERTGSNSSYAIFAFFVSDRNEEPHFELQFSIEDGVMGFDWTLLGDIKERDAQRFTEYARQLGHEPKLHEMNGVRYVRVDDGDLVGLCRSVMVSFYGVDSDTWVELVAKRFAVTGFSLSTH
jgi:hypothetical protein